MSLRNTTNLSLLLFWFVYPNSLYFVSPSVQFKCAAFPFGRITNEYTCSLDWVFFLVRLRHYVLLGYLNINHGLIKRKTFNKWNHVFFLAAQYFASTMMIVGMSVVVTVIVLQFHHHDPHGGKMPKWVSICSAFSSIHKRIVMLTQVVIENKITLW